MAFRIFSFTPASSSSSSAMLRSDTKSTSAFTSSNFKVDKTPSQSRGGTLAQANGPGKRGDLRVMTTPLKELLLELLSREPEVEPTLPLIAPGSEGAQQNVVARDGNG